MKKRALLFLIIFLAIPLVSASLKIEGPDKSQYNLGDEVKFSGYVFREEALSGFLRFIVKCDNSTFQAPLTSVSIASGEKITFPDQLLIPKIVIPNSLSGICLIESSLISNNNVIETSSSNQFTIIEDLNGNFDIDESRIQIGDSFTLIGSLFKLNGQSTDGSVEIYFENKEISYLIDVVNTQNGKLTYNYTATALPAGNYNIDLKVDDVYGNQEFFDNVATFTLISEIYIFVKTDKVNVKPGTEISVLGDVTTVFQEPINKGDVEIRLDSKIFTAQVSNGKFEKLIRLGDTIKSGKHTFIVNVEDEFGNKGSSSTNIYVEPLATKLENKLNKNIFKPEEVMEITPLLYDQADDLISEDIGINILNPKNENIFSNVVKTNNKINFKIPQFSIPGTYKIKTGALDLSIENNIEVESVIDAEVKLENQTIVVRNIGNVEYKKPVKVDFNNGQYTIVKKASLDLDKSLLINLFEEVPTGKYNIKVSFGDDSREFENVDIVGRPKTEIKNLYLILIVIILVILYLLFLHSKKKKIARRKREKERIEARKRVQEIKKTKQEKEEKKPYRFTFGENRKKEIEEYRNRVLKEIKKTEEKGREKRGELFRNSNDKGKGMFNMFD